jgi:ATP-dependent RNA helicase DDX51/DBP6
MGRKSRKEQEKVTPFERTLASFHKQHAALKASQLHSENETASPNGPSGAEPSTELHENGDSDMEVDEPVDPVSDPMNLDANSDVETEKLHAQNPEEEEVTDLYFPTMEEDTPITAAERRKLKLAALPKWLAAPETVIQDADEHLQALVSDQFAKHPEFHIDQFGLDSRIVRVAKRHGIQHLLSIQRAVVPKLLQMRRQNRAAGRASSQCHDLLVTAPTGSGKTLAYVLPIVHTLASRVIPRIRALVVVPTRDLVRQVRDTFIPYAQSVGLHTIALAGGGTRDFKAEQESLCGNSLSEYKQFSEHPALEYHAQGVEFPILGTSCHTPGGYSNVDIVICTPGRLLDHVRSTPNFSLQHLEFLVLDEADRVLESAGSWWHELISAMEPSTPSDLQSPKVLASSQLFSPTPMLLRPRCLPLRRDVPMQPTKLLFSATLSRNPEKLALLQLQRPHLLATQSQTQTADQEPEKYVFPATLHESMTVVPSVEDKIVGLTQMLLSLNGFMEPNPSLQKIFKPLEAKTNSRVLVFTKSADGARRLAGILKLLLEGQSISVCHVSRELTQSNRNRVLKEFTSTDCRGHILVASDLLARGMDLPDVDMVINYDPPGFLPQYVHRVGRTARAGHTGVALTILLPVETGFFRRLMQKREIGKLPLVNVPRDTSIREKMHEIVRKLQGGPSSSAPEAAAVDEVQELTTWLEEVTAVEGVEDDVIQGTHVRFEESDDDA